VDPPYRIDSARVAQLLEDLVAAGAIEGGALVVWEHGTASPVMWPETFEERTTRRYGSTQISIAAYRGGESRYVNRAICPGTFDPVTSGHLDIIERATVLFDEVVVAVAKNPEKGGGPLFDVERRCEFIRDATSHLPTVIVRPFDSLLIHLAEELDAHVVIKGLRAVSDFEREFQMAQLNRRLDTSVETMFIMAIPEYTYLSSSAVKEIAALGGPVKGLVPDAVAEAMAACMQAR
jgi:pantetheine-phosphate adenylyltransferase